MLDPENRPPATDAERVLLRKLQSGDRAAFREFYESRAPSLLRLLVRYLKNRPLAEDVMQETFLAAFKGISGLRGEGRLSTWLATIGLRRAQNAQRASAARPRAAEVLVEEIAGEPLQRSLEDRELARRTLTLLDRLDEPKRTALLLFAEGYTAGEIAEVTGEARGTILSRLSRGRAELVEIAQRLGQEVPMRAAGGEK